LKISENELTSYILVCKDLQKAYEAILSECEGKNYKSFIKNDQKQSEDFLLEDAKNVVKEAFVAQSETKILILGAKNYNIYAQNSLLKILEEPPRNIVFIIVCESKSVLLPTIRSRLLIKELRSDEQKVELDLDLERLTPREIYDFVQKNSRIKKNELKVLVQTIVTEAIIKAKMDFTTKELDYFQELLYLSDLNSRATNILISLLLSIYQKRA